MTSRATVSRPKPWQVLAALIAVQVLFGLSYIFSKLLMETFPPLIWACIRSLASGVLMGVICIILRRPHPKLSSEFIIPLCIFSLLGGVLTQGLFLVGLHFTSSSNSSIIFTLVPIFTLSVVIAMGEEKLNRQRAFGFLLSFVGVLALNRVEHFTFSDESTKGNLITLGSCLSYALFIALSKQFLQKYDRLWITSWMFLFTGFGLMIPSHSIWAQFTWPQMTPTLWLLIAYGIIGATLLAYFLVIWTITHSPPSRVALFSYLQPVLVSLVAFFFLGNPTDARTVVASLLIFLGVTCVIRQGSTTAG